MFASRWIISAVKTFDRFFDLLGVEWYESLHLARHGDDYLGAWNFDVRECTL